jgi:DNA repair protein RecO (recombination protein O)
MQWTDEAVVIGTRRHGESSVIVELMTREHGRHVGLVRGGRSRRLRPVLQPGNGVTATWRARLDEHLGYLAVEPLVERAAGLMENPAAIYGIQATSALLRLLPEREAHPRLYDRLNEILEAFGDPVLAAALIARLETRLLEDLGFGLDLDQCAVTGSNDDLAYVSPKTGRAVTRSAGERYRDRLLPLPAFLIDGHESAVPSRSDIAAAFRLTGYFLARHVYDPRGLPLPEARLTFLAWLARASTEIPAALEWPTDRL